MTKSQSSVERAERASEIPRPAHHMVYCFCMVNDETTIGDVMEFLQENILKRQDLNARLTSVEKELRQEIRLSRQRVMTHFDNRIADLLAPS